MYVKMSSINGLSPQYRKEKIANDMKHALGFAAVGNTGIAASIAVMAKPELITKAKAGLEKGYTVTANQAKEYATKILSKDSYKKVAKEAKDIFNKLKSTSAYKKVKEMIKPAIEYVKKSAIGLKNEISKLVDTVSSKLAKVPSQYKVAGLIALATVALLSKISHSHAYNEGKIDAKYGK